ncbi:MAG TPA: hypothetical protein VFC39_21120 [Acidobacteriaceae bacterium]|nr:hypothetical protein [Acidobacteriaceae bacterium]
MGMSEIVPNVETPQESAAQGRSTIRFPYLDQDDAVAIAKEIFELGGKSCEKSTLAAKLGVSSDGGGFNLRVGTAKMYGFISGEKKTLHLTDLGAKVVEPITEKAARSESFLAVPLYKALFEDWEGKSLPANPGLEGYIERLGVAPKQKDKARQVFQRSAQQAGYFAYGSNRLVRPTAKALGETEQKPAPPPPVDDTKTDAENDGNSRIRGDGGGEPPHKNPFIQGLLSKLPEENSEWSMDARKKWLQLAVSVFDVSYKAATGDEGELAVTLTKNSAN